MKKFKVIITGIIILLLGYFTLNKSIINVRDNEKAQEVKIADAVQAGEHIVFGRYGNIKGIYCTTSDINKSTNIINSDFDMLGAAHNKLFFNYWTKVSCIKYKDLLIDNSDDTEDRCIGVYSCDLDGRNMKCLAKDYIMWEKPVIGNSGNIIIFCGEKIKYGLNDKCIDFGVYSIERNSPDPCKLNIKITGREGIEDISFLGDNEIVYSKQVYINGNYKNWIYKYNLASQNEKRFITDKENILNPAASPDGKKLSYLCYSQVKGIYGIYIADINDISKTIFTDLSDAVVGDSLRWSPDSNKILYTVLSDNIQDGRVVRGTKIKIIDISKLMSSYIDKGYIGTFSPDSRSIAYCDYEIIKSNKNKSDKPVYKCTEKIYKRKIGDLKSTVLQFDESSLYSKSINAIYWYE